MRLGRAAERRRCAHALKTSAAPMWNTLDRLRLTFKKSVPCNRAGRADIAAAGSTMNPDWVEMLDQTPAPISSASAPASGRDTEGRTRGAVSAR